MVKMLHFTSGDMFDLAVDIRVNTVNCVGVMGAGVALVFKTRFPAMFRAYKEACDAGEVKPGSLQVWRTSTEWILNFPTKRHWRDGSRYDDIEAGLKALRTYLGILGRDVRVALPALGCGHGGLDWSRVSKLIEHHLATTTAEIFVFEPADSRRACTAAAQQKQHEDASQLDLFGEGS
jgi:O-acetyl-ADP-ribose deacetylase (regulator of RNase III)